MKALWSDSDTKRRDFFRRYAIYYKVILPDNADYVLVTDDEGNFCGFAALVCRANSAEIVFLIIEESRRKQGYGSFLLSEIEEALKNSRIPVVRVVLPPRDEMTGLFTKAGYQLFDGEAEYAVPIASLHYCASFRKQIEEVKPDKAKTLSEITPDERKLLLKYFDEEKITDHKLLDNRRSSVVLKGGEVRAVFLCERVAGGVIIEYMYTEKDHPEYLMDCLRATTHYIAEHPGKERDLMISVSLENEKGVRLLKYFTDGMIEPEIITREIYAVKNV
ncbi:MAG: GNAT family N-acetyltransferase [Lachnospiraceae bacterium]|nr:GNAT family N-acetyltransferase [Lachnospiraceae bacterium]